MKDIKCPSCGKTFRIDPSSFEEILLQIKDEEFNKQIKERLILAEEDNKKALEILKRELKIQLIEQNRIKESEIKTLESRLKIAEEKKTNALNDLKSQATNKINLLNNELIKLKDEITNQSLISELTLKNKYKFAEIASSLAYYLKSFSNINKLLDYICLIFKHIFSENIILIMHLNYEGEIWNENIKISANYKYLTFQEEIHSFLHQFHFSKNFKIKEIQTFENSLKNKFNKYKIETKKILSRGKCRGFIYIFSKDISSNSITEDSNFNFIQNCLAVGLENYCLIKTKKKHENLDREISTGAEIQSQLLPDYCPIIYGVDLAAHCRPALQLGGDYYDFMCLKTNISEKRKEKARWALVIGDVMG